MEKTENVETSFKCSRCHNSLVILEDKRDNVTLFGCLKCDCYVVLLPWHLKEFKRGKFFNWKGLMRYIYRTYLDARDLVCQ
jgi:hypothetical protein